LHEPATTLTDYLLAIECVAFAVALARDPAAGAVRRWFVVLFASAAAASFAGGSVHGFFPDPQSAVGRSMWLITMLSIGLTAAAMAAIAGYEAFGEKRAPPTTSRRRRRYGSAGCVRRSRRR